MKTLVIVDIQKRYANHFNWRYLEKVQSFLAKHAASYEKIVLLIDLAKSSLEGDAIPKGLERYITHYVFKMYNDAYDEAHLEQLAMQYLTKLQNPVQKVFRTEEGAFIHVQATQKSHLVYVDNHFLSLESLLGDSAVDMIGGGKEHCVKKTKVLLKLLGIQSITILNRYCYTISLKPSFIKKALGICTVQNTWDLVDWTFAPNTNEALKAYLA